MAEDKKHICTKADIDWDDEPTTGEGDGEGVNWYGKCRVCGREVYEVYIQTEELFDAATQEEVYP